MKKSRKLLSWKNVHKWAGTVFTVFLLMFCVSGVLLNHRNLIRDYNVSRTILPPDYHIENYNNGTLKGTLELASDSILIFGNVGVWRADRTLAHVEDFNQGLPKGMDTRNIRGVVKRGDELWCAATYDVFRRSGDRWQPVVLPGNKERISDITLTPDEVPIAVTRSGIYIFTEDGGFVNVPLKTPVDYQHKTTLFKTLWHLHSGELFGMVGRIAVDIVAIIIIFLCITGLMIFLLPYRIRHSAGRRIKSLGGLLRWSSTWHNKMGFLTIFLTLSIAFTGICLRPPLMVPMVLTSHKPLPNTSLDSDNAWHDKLRALRWDSEGDRWLLSTSEGFFTVDKNFFSPPKRIETLTPPVSPMGVTVLEEIAPGKWLVGSFSGLYEWDITAGKVIDCFTRKPYIKKSGGRPIFDHLVSGYSKELDKVFDYEDGAEGLPEMSESMKSQPLALWNVALETHVGRIYSFFLGPLVDLFVFLSGGVFLIILISGFVLYKRRTRAIKRHREPS